MITISQLLQQLFRKKTFEQCEIDSSAPNGLKRVLTLPELTLLGIGAIVGVGIFVLTGIAAADYAGPGLVFSFLIAGIASGLAALCYAEFASVVPVAGSAYTYSYVTLGEFFAWFIGWDLILEYSIFVAAIAIGWSGYMVSILSLFGITFPAVLAAAPGSGGIINLPAMLVILMVTLISYIGVKESSLTNAVVVAFKLGAILLFIVVGAGLVDLKNWTPFFPYGISGVISGAALIFTAYIGFDAISTAAEEVKDPQRTLPRAIIISLAICTVLYIIVTLVMTGILPYSAYHNIPAPAAYALEQNGIGWGTLLVSLGAVVGLVSGIIVFFLGQTRILFAMARDGLLPRTFAVLHPVHRTPAVAVLVVGLCTAIFSGFIPLGTAAELINIGTLAAFIMVSLSVLVLRKTNPGLNRPFRCPLVPYIPIAAVLSCGYLILALPQITQIRFVVWLVIGILIYFSYGFIKERRARTA